LRLQSGKAADELLEVAQSTLQAAKNDAMDVMFILMPTSSRTSKDSPQPYGSYEMPSHLHHARGNEAIISSGPTGQPPASKIKAEAPETTSPAYAFKTIIPRCHASENSCVTATGNCSGHGTCARKFGEDKQDACYACKCIPSVQYVDGKFYKSTYWGGSACQKVDISAQFWLLAGFSVAAVGLVSWGIGMLFSIGEEKLPGVIGAGVSGAKTR
jgi:hypothetical protein